VIALRELVARTRRVTLSPLTLTLGAGAHALLGGDADGPSTLLAVLSGNLRARAGLARVLEGPPEDPRLRAHVAYLPLDATLPGPLRVHETLAAASELRGGAGLSPLARLEAFGLGGLVERMGRTLSPGEARAVALAEAVTSNVQVILVEEPGLVDARAAGALAEALRARARGEAIPGLGGARRAPACVVVSTGSPRDAASFADDVLTFAKGTLVRRAPAGAPSGLADAEDSCVRVLCSDPQRLAASVATCPEVRRVGVEGALIVAEGASVSAVAEAVARAALREGVTIDMLRPDLAGEAHETSGGDR
jgi:ABC-type multidrug transport system ATPase subunit